MAYELKEKEIQKQILEYLQLKRIFHFRNNVGAGSMGGRFVRFGIPGAPDIFVLKNGKLYGLEVKRPGKKQSPLQKEFGDKMIAAGGQYEVVFNLDRVMEIL
jgi:hypothetical protein